MCELAVSYYEPTGQAVVCSAASGYVVQACDAQ